MVFHFHTRKEATEHLITNGWTLLKNGRWISRDKSCVACIHPPVVSDGWFAVSVQEIETV